MKKNYVILPVYNDLASLKKVLEILNQSFKTLKSFAVDILIFEFVKYPLRAYVPTADKIPMIAITTRRSMRVKPF